MTNRGLSSKHYYSDLLSMSNSFVSASPANVYSEPRNIIRNSEFTLLRLSKYNVPMTMTYASSQQQFSTCFLQFQNSLDSTKNDVARTLHANSRTNSVRYRHSTTVFRPFVLSYLNPPLHRV